MEDELTLGDIYEEIAEQLAQARTRALMGEREAARPLFHCAAQAFQRFREVLRGYPGYYALEYAFQATQATLCIEEMTTEPAIQPLLPAATKPKPRRRIKKAA